MLGSTYTHTICIRPLYNSLRDTIIITLLVCLLVLIMLHSKFTVNNIMLSLYNTMVVQSQIIIVTTT